MANIMDYLDWRGDLPFTADPFNIIDNLILTEMVYTKLDGIVPESFEESITVAEAADAVFTRNTEEELLAQEHFTKMAPFVLRKMKDTVRFGNVRLCGYVNNINAETESQMAVVSCMLDDGSVFVAFRGTDETMIGWKEDFNLSYMIETEGQRLAVEYLNESFKGKKVKLRVGGHSKGGNFAVYASAFCRKSIKKKIIGVYSNDGPGFRQEVIETEQYAEILPLVTTTVPQGTIVSVLLDNELPQHIVKSSASGMRQHDMLTWQVIGKSFEEAEKRAGGSELIDATVDSWLASVPDEQRASFVESLYGVLKSTGADKLEDIGRDPLRSGAEIIKKMRSMPREQQEEFRKVLGKLLKSGGQQVKEAAKKKFGLE